MTQLLPGLEGEARSRGLSQFYTPQWLAERVVRWSRPVIGETEILEPAAGRGALIRPLVALGYEFNVYAWDIDVENCRELRSIDALQSEISVHTDDWLQVPDFEFSFHLCLMNPPYEGNQDIAFVEKACRQSDRVVGVFQSRIVHSQGRAAFWRHHDIRRLVFLSERPHFGGEHSAKTDFLVMELVRRERARKQGEATPAAIEWWLR